MRPATVLLAVTALLGFSAPARADGFLVPFIGYDFGGDAGSCPNLLNDCSTKKMSFGASLGFMGGGVIGLEEDFSYAPDFFGQSPSFGDNSVLTAMTDLIVGAPLGPVRPYLTGGVGAIHTNIGASPQGLINAFTKTSFGYDVGGGVMGFFSSHVGLRGDLRHFHTFDDLTIAGFNVNNNKLNFWRASLGLALQF